MSYEPFYVNECKGCGWCCRVIGMDVGWRFPERRKADLHPLLYEGWVSIPVEVARRLNPWWAITHPWATDENIACFTCLHLENGRCLVHGPDKPYTCSGYPMYGTGMVFGRMPVPFCHYNRLVLP